MLSDFSFKEGHPRFTKAPFKPLDDTLFLISLQKCI